MKILLIFATAATVIAIAGFAGSASHAAQNHLYSFGVTTQNPGCTEDPPGFCLSATYAYRILAVQHGNDDAWGTFSRFNYMTGVTRRGDVTCMTVADGKAAIGGFETSPDNVPFILWVQDRGVPGDSVSDRISPYAIFPPGDPDLARLPADFPRTCPSPDSFYGYFPQASGDVTVASN